MSCCQAKWVVPCLAPLFRLLGDVYQAVAWQWTPGSDSTIASFIYKNKLQLREQHESISHLFPIAGNQKHIDPQRLTSSTANPALVHINFYTPTHKERKTGT
jgi:hypothetical protein